jgi:hypothetical protein
MRDIMTTVTIGIMAALAQAGQTLPADPTTWGTYLEKLGIIGVLCGVIFILLKRETTTKEEHKAALLEKDEEIDRRDKIIEGKDARIEALQRDLNDVRVELFTLRKVVLETTNLQDVTATTRRSLLTLERHQDKAEEQVDIRTDAA